jgi:hypothetical protein
VGKGLGDANLVEKLDLVIIFIFLNHFKNAVCAGLLELPGFQDVI